MKVNSGRMKYEDFFENTIFLFDTGNGKYDFNNRI